MEKDTKIQMTTYDISGRVYKQSFYKDFKRANSAYHRLNIKYGGGLRREIKTVPVSNKRFINARTNIESSHCFCPETPLWANVCSKCGKSPYTN